MNTSKSNAVEKVEMLDRLLTALGNPHKTDEDWFLIHNHLDYDAQQRVAAYAKVDNYEGCRRFLVNKIFERDEN